MSVGGISVSNASFMIEVDGVSRKIELGSLMMAVNLEYVGELDTQIADRLSEMVDRNTRIETATEVLNVLRQQLESKTADSAREITVGDTTKSLSEWCEYLGAEYTEPSGQSGSDSWTQTMETNIGNVQSALDLLNTDSETATLELQNLTEKRSNALQQASNLLKSANEATQAVLRNI